MVNSLPRWATRHSLPVLLGIAAAWPAAAQSDQTIVITATRHAMNVVDAPAAMSVVTQQQIADQGADNLLDAVRGETGLSLQGRTISGRKTLSLRGMDGRHTLFLVDGMRIGNTDGVVGHSDFQYDWVSAEEIDRIELVRGPMSVLYGAEALGGVVNVLTRAPGARWDYRLMVEGSQADGDAGGDGHRSTVSLGGPLGERLRLAVSAVDNRRQAVSGVADARITALEGRHKQDGSLRLLWLPAKGHEVDLTQRSGQEERWAVSRETRGQRRYYDSISDLSRSHSALGWRGDWGGDWALQSQLRAYGSRIEVENVRTNGVAALRPQTLSDQVVEGQLTASPAAGRLFTAGFEWRDEVLANAAIPGGEGDAEHQALYAQAEIEAAKGLALTAGLRLDRHQMFGSELSPRLYAVWRPAAAWVIKGGLGHGFKAPTLKQISPGYQEDEGPNTFFSNPALRPESNNAAEIGFGWDGQGLGAQLMLFRNQVDDLVIARFLGTVSGRGQYVFENIEQARLQGLEAEAHVPLPAGFKLGLSYTYLDARDGSGTRLEKRPRHTVGLRLDFRQAAWRAGLRVEHHADQVLSTGVVGAPYQPVPSLTRVSAHLVRELGHGLELSAGVDNLTQLRLADESPLYTWTEAPRTWRLALRGRW